MFKFCRIGNTNLICYPNGLILRQNIRSKKWKICKGYKRKDGYLEMRIDGKGYLQHRVLGHAFKILDLHDKLVIDHIDINPSNNNISNFRPVTRQQNNCNKNTKGYYWDKRDKKWIARIQLDGKIIYLGRFDKEGDAKNAYLKAKPIYHKYNIVE
jgi:hypothetical protein